MVNMLTGRRDRYVGIDDDDQMMRAGLRWLPKANWFPLDEMFGVKVEHLGPTWANFHVMYLRDRIATRCFVCLDAEASPRTWGMAHNEQAWTEDLERKLPEPPVPWLAVVVPADVIPPHLYRFLVPIERGIAWAIMRLRTQ